MSRRIFRAIAVAGLALLASGCADSPFFQTLYGIGRDTCVNSRQYCDNHADTYGRPVTPIPPANARPDQLPY